MFLKTLKQKLPASLRAILGMDLCFGQAVNVWLETIVRVLSCGNHGVIKDCRSSSPAGCQVNQTAFLM